MSSPVAGQVVATAERRRDGVAVGHGGPGEAGPARHAAGPAGPADKTLAASPDGQTLAVFDGGPQAVLWDVTDPAHPARMATLTDAAGITAVTFSPDGHTVATSNRDKNTILWDLAGAAPAALATLPAAYPLKFSPDGRTGVTSGASVIVWDLTDPAHPVQGATIVDPPSATNILDAVVEFNPTLPLVAVQERTTTSDVRL